MTRLSTLTKPLGPVAGIASGVAALVVATLFVAAPTHPDPIDPVGTWDVAAFAFTPTNNSVANNASIDGGEMTIEREAGCRSDPCNLVDHHRTRSRRRRRPPAPERSQSLCGRRGPRQPELRRGRRAGGAHTGSIRGRSREWERHARVRDRVRAHPSLARLRSLRLPVRGDRGARARPSRSPPTSAVTSRLRPGRARPNPRGGTCRRAPATGRSANRPPSTATS